MTTGEQKPGCLASRRVHDGRIVSLDVDTVRYPNGVIGELEIFRHPGASAVVPLLGAPHDPNPHVLLIRQYRYATEGYLFEIPAGRLDEGERPEECASRELREETGYSAEKFVLLTTIFTTPGFTDERIHLFVASGLSAGVASPESDEVLDLCPTPLTRALEMIASGEISDAKTIIGLSMAARHLGTE